MCPQPDVDDSQMSEDCLSMILYVPQSTSGAMPTFMWIHGGSYYVGSATDPGLDGSALAVATNSIVAVIQYRLGALGFMAPSGETNLAVKDVITALKFLQANVEAFGGNGEITIAGQSSGADMIRALLATPSASDLFQKAILQSDPMVCCFFDLLVDFLQNFNQLFPPLLGLWLLAAFRPNHASFALHGVHSMLSFQQYLPRCPLRR
jgi:carboxylesterase type B